MFLALYGLILGFSALLIGGEALVYGATSFAHRLKLSPVTIGVTIVAFGTSLPEMVVSVYAAIQQRPDISTGNIIGSNIQNIAIVLGLIAMICTIRVNRKAIRSIWPAVLISALLAVVVSSNGIITRIEGLILLVCFGLFSFWILSERKRRKGNQSNHEIDIGQGDWHLEKHSIFIATSAIAAGILLLIFGAHIGLFGAVTIAQELGISERVIGLTIVAFGTSLPELVVSIIAVLRKHPSIALGNILGSNIYNIFAVLSVTAIIHPVTIHLEMIKFDLWLMLLYTLFLFPLQFFRIIPRWYGATLFLSYCVYVVYLLAA